MAAAAPTAAAGQQQHTAPAGGQACQQTAGHAGATCDYVRFGRVLVQELSSAELGSPSAVMKLCSKGSYMVACASLGSVTVLRPVAVNPFSWVQLYPVATNSRSSFMTADFMFPEPAAEPAAPPVINSHMTNQPAAVHSHAGMHSSVSGYTTGGRTYADEVADDRGTGSTGADHQQQQLEFQAVLLSTLSRGLVLFEHDLMEDRVYLSTALRLAQEAWEDGHRLSARSSILMTDLSSTTTQVWVGSGEAAPWELHGGPAQQVQDTAHMRAAQGSGQSVAGRQALVAAAAAAGSAEPSHLPADWLRLSWGLIVDLHQLETEPLMPSAHCVPAPDSTLLCAARLGLHSEAVQGLDSGIHEAGDGQPAMTQELAQRGSTVLCLSASGGVSVAQLLPPKLLRELEAWQRTHRVAQQNACSLEHMLEMEPADDKMVKGSRSTNSDSQNHLELVEKFAKWRLRVVQQWDRVAEYGGYARTPGALADTADYGATRQGQQQQQQQQRAGLAFLGTIDGDVLFTHDTQLLSGCEQRTLSQVVLQHKLWQDVL